ncbi:MAG: hypothetical protein MJK18_05095, partial [Bdellovibrionales bacterium]|nr:hypothetical protein [Bdellovibrionales bacterium]
LRPLDPNKPIVMIDYSRSGRTFRLFRRFISFYFPEYSFRYYRVMESGDARLISWSQNTTDFLRRSRRFILKEGSRLAQALQLQAYNSLALADAFYLVNQQLVSDGYRYRDELRDYLREFFIDMEAEKTSSTHSPRLCRRAFSLIQ